MLIFSLKDLYIKNDYNISRQIEQIIVDKLASLYNLGQEDIEISQGSDSSYDFRIKDKTFELKIMSTPYYNIEVSRSNGDPSGLTASKSDYYIIVNPGYLYGKEVMKLRVVPTDILREAVRNASAETRKEYKPNEYNSLGSVCYQINPRLPHDFLGYFQIKDKISGDYYIDFNSLAFFYKDQFSEIFISKVLTASSNV